jgi:hypothetical protein
MPRPRLNLADIDLAELQIAVLHELEAPGPPERRQQMRANGTDGFANLIDEAGGARSILREALKSLRRSA